MRAFIPNASGRPFLFLFEFAETQAEKGGARYLPVCFFKAASKVPSGLVRITGWPGREVRVGDRMMELSYRRHRFPPVVIQHAVWLYLRFTLSYRDIEDLLAERGARYLLRNGPELGIEVRTGRCQVANRWMLMAE
jgi:hypothetical protein